MKDCFILVGRDGRPSMRLVYSKMKQGGLLIRRFPKQGNRFLRQFVDNDIEKFAKKGAPGEIIKDGDTIIRWGFQEQIVDHKNLLIYNQAAALANASNKLKSRKLFIENGVNCPKLVTKENVDDKDFPVIARPFYHAKARNFVVLNTKDEFLRHYNPGAWYYSAFVNKDREFRVHIGHGRVIAILEKPAPDDKKNLAWNRAVNMKPFEVLRWDDIGKKKPYRAVILEALKAIDAVGLDFGGVDVMTKGDDAYVLEVNTAPTLASSDYVAGRYAKYFDMLARSPKRVPHADWKVVQISSRLPWRDEEMLAGKVQPD